MGLTLAGDGRQAGIDMSYRYQTHFGTFEDGECERAHVINAIKAIDAQYHTFSSVSRDEIDQIVDHYLWSLDDEYECSCGTCVTSVAELPSIEGMPNPELAVFDPNELGLHSSVCKDWQDCEQALTAMCVQSIHKDMCRQDICDPAHTILLAAINSDSIYECERCDECSPLDDQLSNIS